MTETTTERAPDLARQHYDFAQRMTQVSRLVTLGEMAAGLAHELNQPLGAIANYAAACERLLAASEPKTPEVQEALREINAQALRAGEIIRRLRQMVRRHELEHKATDLNELIRELWDLVRSDARSNDVRLIFEPAQSLPLALIDGLQIQQVLFNLIHNAIEAAGAQKDATREVIVRTRQAPDGGLEISISDTGPGVEVGLTERMFDPFCTTKPEGTGLGLTVSRSIVQAHHGKLEYRPNQPTGACFLVTLRAAPQNGRMADEKNERT